MTHDGQSDRSIHRTLVAIFGHPCAGKTSLASAVHNALPAPRLFIEASRDIIFPLLSLCDVTPKSLDIIHTLVSRYGSGDTNFMPRHAAIGVFKTMRDAYGQSWAAHTADQLRSRLCDHCNAVVCGVRSSESARTLKNLGYALVFLDTPLDTCAIRLAQRDGIEMQEAWRAILDEEALYSTSAIAEVADIRLDPTHITTSEVADLLHEIIPAIDVQTMRQY